MSTWVFQVNPDNFRIDDYLTEKEEIYYPLTEKESEGRLQRGDIVYFQRLDGRKRGTGGIIAKCIVTDTPIKSTRELNYITEKLSIYTIKNPPDRNTPVAKLYVERVIPNTTLTVNTLRSHPILKDSLFLTFQQRESYRISSMEARAIGVKWDWA